MIAGELETLQMAFGAEDHFLGRNPERKEKRKAFFQKVGDKIKESGGLAGIGQTVNNIGGLFGQNRGATESAPEWIPPENPPQRPRRKKVPTAVWIIGGVVLLGGLAFVLTNNAK